MEDIPATERAEESEENLERERERESEGGEEKARRFNDFNFLKNINSVKLCVCVCLCVVGRCGQ